MNLDLEAIINANKDSISVRLSEQVQEKVIESLQWNINDTVSQHAQSYLAEEVGPLVKTTLEAHKEDLALAISTAVIAAFDTLSTKITEKAVENISSYKGDQLIKQLFS